MDVIKYICSYLSIFHSLLYPHFLSNDIIHKNYFIEVYMINPVIYTFHLFGFAFSLRWYGVIVMLGVIVAL